MDNEKIETEIKNIKARNARVELDKKNGRPHGLVDFVFVFLLILSW